MSIEFWAGRNGTGKTAGVVEYRVIPCWERGRRVVSNITLYPEELGFDRALYQRLGNPLHDLPRLGRHVRRVCPRCVAFTRKAVCSVCKGPAPELPRWHPLHEGELWSITDNEGCMLFMDEILTLFSSRESQSVDPELAALLNQWRKPDVGPVVGTAPDWKRADVIIRETVGAVIECRPAFPGLQRLLRVAEMPKEPGGWPKWAWFERAWYDAEEYEMADASVVASAALQPVKRRYSFSRRRREMVRDAYDTLEGVSLAEHQKCSVCGGSTPRARCKTPEEHRELALERRGAVMTEYLTPAVRRHLAEIVDGAPVLELVAPVGGDDAA